MVPTSAALGGIGFTVGFTTDLGAGTGLADMLRVGADFRAVSGLDAGTAFGIGATAGADGAGFTAGIDDGSATGAATVTGGVDWSLAGAIATGDSTGSGVVAAGIGGGEYARSGGVAHAPSNASAPTRQIR